ncbi:hypothetical protein CR513_46581, partial [Mucuna pruriens]
MANALATLLSMLIVNREQEMTIQTRMTQRWMISPGTMTSRGAYLLGATENDKGNPLQKK